MDDVYSMYYLYVSNSNIHDNSNGSTIGLCRSKVQVEYCIHYKHYLPSMDQPESTKTKAYITYILKIILTDKLTFLQNFGVLTSINEAATAFV